MVNIKPINPNEFKGNFIEECDPIYRGSRKDRMVKLECVICNNHFIVSYYNAKRIQQVTCSNKCSGVLRRQSEDGNLNNQHYSRWLSMKDRCNNPNNSRYSRYGARGITYSKSFEDFNTYVNYIESLDGFDAITNQSLDRIDNNKGYIEGNLRWASNYIQAANKTFKQSNTSSKFRGVYYCNTHKVWIAKLAYEGKVLFTKHCNSEVDAVLARNNFIIDNKLPHPVQQIRSNV